MDLNYSSPVVFISEINTIIDCSTFVKTCTNYSKLYINHKTFELHNGYPLTVDNLITDTDFINRHHENIEYQLTKTKELFKNLMAKTDDVSDKRHVWINNPFRKFHKIKVII